jgi:hypothetical protein
MMHLLRPPGFGDPPSAKPEPACGPVLGFVELTTALAQVTCLSCTHTMLYRDRELVRTRHRRHPANLHTLGAFDA